MGAVNPIEAAIINAKKRTKATFIVEISGLDVPPDWAAKIEKTLRSQLALFYGDNVIVDPA